MTEFMNRSLRQIGNLQTDITAILAECPALVVVARTIFEVDHDGPCTAHELTGILCEFPEKIQIDSRTGRDLCLSSLFRFRLHHCH